jgi:hypothetical protein
MRRKANSFLVLAKMAAKHAAQQPQARSHQGRPNDKRMAPNRPASAPFQTTLLDPRKLFGQIG